jgi:hypothetical protein
MGKVENMGVINQGKRHEGKLFEEQHKTQKWVNIKEAQ